MNTQVKIIIPLLLLIVSGCAHHQRYYSAYPNEYSRSYRSYYNYPVYYDRRIYNRQPVVEDSRQHTYQHQNRQSYTAPNKHQKSKYQHYENRGYQQSSRKPAKVFVTKQPQYDRYEERSEQYIEQPRPFKQYPKHQKTDNLRYSPFSGGGNVKSHNYSRDRVPFESKHRKQYKTPFTRKFPMGKSSKR